MSRKLDLKLNLSLPAQRGEGNDNNNNNNWRLSISSSSPSSCVSSEAEQGSDSPEATSMVLAACPRCLMYIMLAEEDPKCRNSVLLDFLHDNTRKS